MFLSMTNLSIRDVNASDHRYDDVRQAGKNGPRTEELRMMQYLERELGCGLSELI